MSLTQSDLKQVKQLIKESNDAQFQKIVEVLKQFPTSDELYANFVTKNEFQELKADVNEMKDDISQIRTDVSLLATSMQSLAITVEQHSKDMRVIKTHLHLN